MLDSLVASCHWFKPEFTNFEKLLLHQLTVAVAKGCCLWNKKTNNFYLSWFVSYFF